ncbi:hypothetical protein [Rhizobium sp. Root1220]|uniref:hypothetical protein n=1 Tax=Rhizobium sp. Root1220 TaxID=1736432 RepID=UPI00070154A7|nr:hypothetical protein [Rhizobium sp. Root1220]KQV84051.1 hypothetical protein ASC90_00555 [Rhizobium sp. Root1220]
MDRRSLLLLTVSGSALLAGLPSRAQELPSVTTETIRQTLSNPDRLEDMFIAVETLRLNLAIAMQSAERSANAMVRNGFDSFARLRDQIRQNVQVIVDSITTEALDLGEAAGAAVRDIARQIAEAGISAGSVIYEYLMLKYQEFLIAAKSVGVDVNSWMCETQPFNYYCRR